MSRSVASLHPYLRNRYQLLELIGNTPYRRTYIAQDLWDSAETRYVIKHYARKVTKRGNLEQLVPSSRDLLCREWNCSESLAGYSGISQGITTFQEKDECYLVQEWIEGQSLADYLTPDQNGLKAYSEIEVIQWLQGILPILAHLHSEGWSHGDLKPSHVIYCQREQTWKLVDLGRARPVRGGSLIPQSVKNIAKMPPFGYMPIERIQGRYYASSDLYSLGMMGLQLLTGLKPLRLRFCWETGKIDWEACLGQPLVLPEFGEGLGKVLSRMANYFPEQRYQSVSEVLKALQQLESSVVITGEREAGEEDVDISFVSLAWTAEKLREFTDSLPWYVERLPILSGVGIGFLAVNGLNMPWGEVRPTFNFIAESSPNLGQQKSQEGQGKANLALPEVTPEVQDFAQQWRQEWQLATVLYQRVVDAIAQQNWEQVLTLASSIPQTTYWQDQLQPLVQQAQQRLDLQARKLFQQATRYAKQKQYNLALNTLAKISPHTASGRQVQPKLVAFQQQRQGENKQSQSYQASNAEDFEPGVKPDQPLADDYTPEDIPPIDPNQVIIASADLIDPIEVEVKSLFTAPGYQLREISPLL